MRNRKYKDIGITKGNTSGDNTSRVSSEHWHFVRCIVKNQIGRVHYTPKHKKPTKGAFGGMSKFNKKLKEMSKFNKKLKAEREYLNVITSTQFDTQDEHKNMTNFNNWNAEKVA